jgi:glycosyltransferase involved in cell wall biosynthesis
MSEALASIILPTYNRAYCVAATIDGVLRQSYSALEVIVVDDGSTDGTGRLITEKYAADRRVRYHYRANGGVSAARNTGIGLARGAVLVFCDSDDLWAENKLLLQMATFQRFPEVNLVWTDVSAVDPQGVMIHERYTRVCYPAWRTQPVDSMFERSEALSAFLPEQLAGAEGGRVYVGDVFATMVAGTLINMPAVAVRAALPARVGNFDESMKTGEDYDFNLRVCGVGPVAFIDVPTLRYRIGAPDQLTRPTLYADQARNWFRTLARVVDVERLPAGLSRRRMRSILVGKYQWLGMAEIECGNRRAGRAALWRSIKLGSRSKIVWLAFFTTFLPRGLEESVRTLVRSLRARARAVKSPS